MSAPAVPPTEQRDVCWVVDRWDSILQRKVDHVTRNRAEARSVLRITEEES